MRNEEEEEEEEEEGTQNNQGGGGGVSQSQPSASTGGAVTRDYGNVLPTQSPARTEAPSEPDPFSDDEADNDAEIDDAEDVQLDEDGGYEQLADEYRAIPALDTYEAEGIVDEEEAGGRDERIARAAAEAALERRDRAERGARRRRFADILEADADMDGDEDGGEARARRQRLEEREGGEAVDVEAFALEEPKGPLKEWLLGEGVKRQVERRFKDFLNEFSEDGGDGQPCYALRIREMCKANRQSLEVNYIHLSQYEPILAVWVADEPRIMLEYFHAVANEVVLSRFENYASIHDRVFVRITDLPIVDAIRDIRQSHLNSLIKISGVVTRRTGVFPQLHRVKYDCVKCSYTIGPLHQADDREVKVSACPYCGSAGPFTVNVEQTVYRNYQKVTLQESPSIVPPGRLPRHKEVLLLDDLIDVARPGDEIEVCGIYTQSADFALNAKNGFPVFSTMVEANYVYKSNDAFAAYRLSDEDRAEMLELSRDPRVAQRIVRSVAPSIYGHEDIKTGIALAMFGGQEKQSEGNHRLRGDINMLLLGDPGTAKSQFLKYVEKTFPRAVYTTGKGASAVGLTASVHKDPITREWTLEGGALVLADRGVCLIDEFDKMNDQDRVSIHEAMEQQSISISKAGIVTSLQARCSVIAAANPVGGRYDSSRTFAENVELTDPILSRFDILCVVKDVVDDGNDSRLAKFVVGSHMRSHPESSGFAGNEAGDGDDETSLLASFMQRMPEDAADTSVELIPQATLRKYIAYARSMPAPKLYGADMEKISRVYADLRRESMTGQGIPIAVRHIESIVRCAESHARMHLRKTVTDEDVDLAIRVMLESFIGSQKFSVQRSLRRRFNKYISRARDMNALLLHTLRSMARDAARYEEATTGRRAMNVKVKTKSFEAAARKFGVADLDAFYRSIGEGREFKIDGARENIICSES